MADRVSLVPARHAHIGAIARRMRAMDAMECRAFGRDPKTALRVGLTNSAQAWTALVDGRPEAMFGVVVNSVLTGDAVPWFLGTDEVYRHGRELLAWGPGMVERLHDSSLTLRNLVSVHNSNAIRLLERWGFTVRKEVILSGGIAFYPFEKVPG